MTRAASGLRRALWRTVLALTGGLRQDGEMPPGPCVIVANHSSHADTAALLATLPARRRPVVAAAADYWFGQAEPVAGATGPRHGPRVRGRRQLRARRRRQLGARARRQLRGWACRGLCGAFPVRRQGGGSADLLTATVLLAAGRDVIIYPEGTRSRDGLIGDFRVGAARLAAAAGAPLVPVGITGTRALLAPGGRLRRAQVVVRIGAPLRLDDVRPPLSSHDLTTIMTRARSEVCYLTKFQHSR